MTTVSASASFPVHAFSDDDLFAQYQQTQPDDRAPAPALVPSVHQITNPTKLYYIKSRVSTLWGFPNVRKYNPTPNPISIERKDLGQLTKKPYMISEKSDGVQYLLLLDTWPMKLCGGRFPTPCALMINRNYDVYEVQVVAQADYFQGTLFIGEMVWEYEGKASAPPRQLFLAFELVAFKGNTMVEHRDYMARYMTMINVLSTPNQDVTRNPRKWLEVAETLADHGKIVCEGNRYALAFRPKRCVPINCLKQLWQQHSSLRHQSDGLIFTPVHSPIGHGTQPDLFKWKPHHTLDFEVDGTQHAKTGLWSFLIFYRDKGQRIDASHRGVFLPKPEGFDDVSESVQYSELPLVLVPNDYMNLICLHYNSRSISNFSVIMECSCRLPDASEWSDDIPMVECIPLKVRPDKTFANDIYTIDRTMVNMRENIGISELCEMTRQSQSSF